MPRWARAASALDRMAFAPALFTRVAAALGAGAGAAYGTEVTVALADLAVAAVSGGGLVAGIGRGGAPLLGVAPTADLVFDLAEAACGGGGGEAPFRPDRAPSDLELGLATPFVEEVAAAFGDGFSATPLARSEPGAGPRAPRARLRVGLFGREHDLLVPVRDAAAFEEAFGPGTEGEADWSVALARAVRRAPVRARVLMRQEGRSLRDVARLAVGDVLRLDASADAPVLFEAGGTPLFSCRLGQADGRYTVRIDDEARA